MNHSSIMLAASTAAFEDRLRNSFGGALNGSLRRLDTELTTSEQIIAAIADASPAVVALGPDMPVDEALAVAQGLDATHPEISVLLVGERSPEILEAALRAGVRDIVLPGAADEELRSSFDRALEIARRRRGSLGGDPSAAGGPRPRVITVLAPKGGSGKTTVATNLALGLIGAAAGSVALLDLDLQFGDIATAMRLMPEHSIADAARTGADQDPMALKLLLTPHPSGIYALCAPDSPAEGEEVTAENAANVARLLSDEFTHLVIDTAAGITESTLAAVELSTDLILLCTFDVPSVRSLRKLVQALDALGMVHQRRHFVLNRADSRVGLVTEDVEATVGMTVDVAISSSRAVPLAMNQGSPLLESDPRSPVARQMLELTQRFVDQPLQSGGSRLFRRGSR